jgi:hypothetical protein
MELDAAGLPRGPVQATYLRARPEARLQYPGAQTVKQFWSDEQSGSVDGGRAAAFAGAVMASTDPPEQIHTWYEKWLQERGWTSTTFLRATHEHSVRGYIHGQREISRWLLMNHICFR